jgi:hypothetical protein
VQLCELDFSGHLTVAKLESELDRIDGHGEIGLLVDCSNMTGYDADARRGFMEWHRSAAAQVQRSAVVTDRRMWQMIVAAMAGASRIPLKAFSTHAEAREWLSGCA